MRVFGGSNASPAESAVVVKPTMALAPVTVQMSAPYPETFLAADGAVLVVAADPLSADATADGSVFAAATHPNLDGGQMVGHGGAALRLYVALTQAQHVQLEQMGQVECPLGRQSEYYWPLKADADAAVHAAVNQAEVPEATLLRSYVIRPVSVTYVGLKEMTSNGTLASCDAAHWRLYAPLRTPPPRDFAGRPYYMVHAAYTIV